MSDILCLAATPYQFLGMREWLLSEGRRAGQLVTMDAPLCYESRQAHYAALGASDVADHWTHLPWHGGTRVGRAQWLARLLSEVARTATGQPRTVVMGMPNAYFRPFLRASSWETWVLVDSGLTSAVVLQRAAEGIDPLGPLYSNATVYGGEGRERNPLSPLAAVPRTKIPRYVRLFTALSVPDGFEGATVERHSFARVRDALSDGASPADGQRSTRWFIGQGLLERDWMSTDDFKRAVGEFLERSGLDGLTYVLHPIEGDETARIAEGMGMSTVRFPWPTELQVIKEGPPAHLAGFFSAAIFSASVLAGPDMPVSIGRSFVVPKLRSDMIPNVKDMYESMLAGLKVEPRVY